MNEKSMELVPQDNGGTTELAMSATAAAAMHEVQGAIIIARKFPRNEDAAYGKIIKSCERPAFAAVARYRFPRGGKIVEGLSIKAALELARAWGNIRYGLDILTEDDESRTIRGWAWDMESNVRTHFDDHFKKLVQRKVKGTSKTEWLVPDERDMRELNNRRGAICVRNAILNLIPPDFKFEAEETVKKTLRGDIAKDRGDHAKRIIRAFGTLNVSVEELELYLGHPVSHASDEEIANLRTIYQSIDDGNSAWAEYAKTATPAADTNGATIDDLTKPPADPPPPADDADEFEAANPQTQGSLLEGEGNQP